MADSSKIIRSALSQSYSDGELTVRVEIYRPAGASGWMLDVINENGGQTFWQDEFATELDTMAEFIEAVEILGLADLTTDAPCCREVPVSSRCHTGRRAGERANASRSVSIKARGSPEA
jgi:hypothetical protein